jgi:hypothetical protein
MAAVRGAVAGFPGSLRTSRPAGAPGPVGRDCYKHPPPMGAGSLSAWLDQARSMNQTKATHGYNLLQKIILTPVFAMCYLGRERAWNLSRPGVAEKRLPRADLRSPDSPKSPSGKLEEVFFYTLWEARGPIRPVTLVPCRLAYAQPMDHPRNPPEPTAWLSLMALTATCGSVFGEPRVASPAPPPPLLLPAAAPLCAVQPNAGPTIRGD